MLKLIKAFFYDTVSWGLFCLLMVTILVSMTAIFSRYERVEHYERKLFHLEYDIMMLQKELERKTTWMKRLEDEPTAWEQVARDKMNYLGPDEVLVTFVPAPK